jgi:hypothetical protein
MSAPASLPERVYILEHVQRDLVAGLVTTNVILDTISKTLIRIETEREAEKARSRFWLKSTVVVLGTLLSAAIIWLASVVNAVQRARL